MLHDDVFGELGPKQLRRVPVSHSARDCIGFGLLLPINPLRCVTPNEKFDKGSNNHVIWYTEALPVRDQRIHAAGERHGDGASNLQNRG